MLSFLAAFLVFQGGVGAVPASPQAAARSLRQTSIAVAVQDRKAATAGMVATPGRRLDGVDPAAPHVLTTEDWKGLIVEVVQNDRIARAAVWLASQPLQVNVASDKFFVSYRIATP